MKINICHLYPDLLNLYGDKGNITALRRRLEWRGIDADVTEYKIDDTPDFSDKDIVFLGGGSDREQKLVCRKLLEQREKIKEYVENGGCLAAVCGGYQLLGNYYKLGNDTIEGLSLVDIYTEQKPGRLIGKVVLKSNIFDDYIVGFEKHGGRTYTNGAKPLGKVLYGYGNNGEDKCEGVIYKNVIGTYLHGPVLPANPKLTDYILSAALEKKYGEVHLAPLDDSAETEAREFIISKYLGHL